MIFNDFDPVWTWQIKSGDLYWCLGRDFLSVPMFKTEACKAASGCDVHISPSHRWHHVGARGSSSDLVRRSRWGLESASRLRFVLILGRFAVQKAQELTSELGLTRHALADGDPAADLPRTRVGRPDAGEADAEDEESDLPLRGPPAVADARAL